MMDTINGRYPLQQDQFSPHIKHVLKSFRSSAMDSLSGPREITHFKRETNGDDDDCFKSKVASYGLPKPITLVQVPKTTDKRIYEHVSEVSETKTSSESDSISPCPPRIPFPPPILSAPDQAWGEVSETSLEGETISCFSVGGEKRLCLPQVLNSVLRGVSISQIHGVCDELHIFCSTCSKEQLDVLKKSGILPPSASQCGLITKTDAERLCSELLNSSAPQLLKTEYDGSNLKQHMDIHHKCFGKCRGTLRPELYTTRPARCIECHVCHGLFAPAKFVSHSHENRETRTVHWGFDSSMWRNYLLLCPGQPDLERKESLFKELKSKFDSTLKRKQSAEVDEEVQDEKRVRVEEAAAVAVSSGLLYPGGFLDPALLYRYYSSWPYVAATLPRLVPPASTAHTQVAPVQNNSKQIRSFLSHDPPVLLHPDRVVRTDEAMRHERHFQPNVALAPQQQPQPPQQQPPQPQQQPPQPQQPQQQQQPPQPQQPQQQQPQQPPQQPQQQQMPPAVAKGRSGDVGSAQDSATAGAGGFLEVLADVGGAAARVAPLLERLPAVDRSRVLDVVRALADEVCRLRADNKQKTTLLEERTAHLRDMMVSEQKDAARQVILEAQDVSVCERTSALDCRKLSNGSSSAPTSPVVTNGVTSGTSRPSPCATVTTATSVTTGRAIGVD